MIAQHQRFAVYLAQSPEDVKAAQRLRYEVFVAELGADGPLVDHDARLERDEFDEQVEHLLAVDTQTQSVIGVYRLLTGDGAKRAGRFYSEDEYDLEVLRNSGRTLLELGRSCLHPEYRGGPAMMLLWQGLAAYVLENKIDILFGVASFHSTDPVSLAEPLSLLHHRHLAPPDLRVRARAAQPFELIPEQDINRRDAMLAVPALIKAYLRLGGFVGDGAFVDHAFNTTDMCLLLDTARLNDRQKAFYTGARA